MTFSSLPHLNALLNSASALLLVTGYYFIRQRNIAAHKRCMLAALCTSALFLASYLIYHFEVGSVRFQGQGWLRTFYFTVLFSHTVLAVTIVPLVIVTVMRALRQRFDRHKAIARWTLPLWFYVSVTGVIVYWMLYQSPWRTPSPPLSSGIVSSKLDSSDRTAPRSRTESPAWLPR